MTANSASPCAPPPTAATRDTIRLAFVAAIQYLPARQRAVLLLRDVLRWRAAEVAELLDEMQKVGAALAPGETRDLTAPGGLVIQLRRIADKPAAVQENEYAVDLTKLMFGGAANQIPAE